MNQDVPLKNYHKSSLIVLLKIRPTPRIHLILRWIRVVDTLDKLDTISFKRASGWVSLLKLNARYRT